MYELAQKLFKIPRSITGNGVRETLKILKEICPTMKIVEVPTGTKVFDWEVPKEWNINEGWIKNSKGEKIVNFKENNLHIMGYSTSVNKKVNLKELLENVYTLPEQPDLIPYITSFYKERYGFCMSDNLKNSLIEDEYEIFIDSELKKGSLTYGEIIIPGESKKEVLLSTYICHPQMANNELSGPCVAIHLAKWLSERKNRYTYRIVFVPETIGSIAYLGRNLKKMKKNTIAGFVLTCLGDNKDYSYLESPYANTLADKVAKNILKHHAPDYKTYSYLVRGSDERQYCSVGVELPVCSVMRTKYGEYPEYHTSADDLNFISSEGLNGGFEVYKKIILALENNYIYKMTCLCEPQLGKRGLYPTTSTKETLSFIETISNFIAYADGKNDLIDISNIINVEIEKLLPLVEELKKTKLVKAVNEKI